MGWDYTIAESNQFKVKDIDAFSQWAIEIGVEVAEHRDNRVSICVDEGHWPTEREDKDGELVEFDIADELKDHLAGDSVAVLTTFYIDKGGSAWGIAINGEGKRRTVSFHNEMHKAAKSLGKFEE